MRCNKARQEIIWERHHGAGSVVPFSLQAGNDIFFRFYLTKAELLALTPADIDFEKQTVTISKTFHRSKGRDIITSPKTKKSNRTIKMPPFLCEEMQEYIKMLYDIKPDERLFTVTKSYLNHEMERGAKQAGVKKIRVHDIRHSAVSLLINMGFSVLAIGERMGHEAEKITYRYAHLFPTVQTEMAEKLEMERMTKEQSGDMSS